MYALMIYSLKVGVCLAVFYLFFKLLLSRETFHRLNRIVVLGAMVASFVLPLCVITVYREVPVPPEFPIRVVGAAAASAAQIPAEAAFSWEQAAVWAYGLGAAAMLLWVLHSLVGVIRIIGRGRREALPDGRRLVVLPQAVTPFSWGRCVVLSEEDLAQNGGAILCHETAHLRLHHSADLLLTDLAGCLQWFNPAMWLLRRELRAIHEFEADEAVLRSGVDAREYQMLLIRKAVGRRWCSVANSLNHSKLKTRITMMLRKKSSRWAAARTLLLLPLAGVALGAFAETRYVVPDDKVTKKSAIRIAGSEISASEASKQLLVLVDGERVASLDGLRTEQIASVAVLRDSVSRAMCGAEAKDGVILVTLIREGDKADSLGSSRDGNRSVSMITIPGAGPGGVGASCDSRLADSDGVVTLSGKPVTVSRSSSQSKLGGNPVIVVDGERYEGCLNDLDVQRIRSMSVYKVNIPERYRAWVGPDNEGVIEITTRTRGASEPGPAAIPEERLAEAQRRMAACFESDEWKAAQQKLADADAYFRSDAWKEAQRKISEGDAYFRSDAWKEAQKRLEMLREMGLEGSADNIRVISGEVSACNTVLGATGGALVTGPDVMSKTRSTDEGSVTVVKGRVTADFSQISEANYRIELDGKPAAKADLERLEPGKIKHLELSTLATPGKQGVLRVRTRR